MSELITNQQTKLGATPYPSVPEGEWHTYRGNEQLTGHCTLRGNIVNPMVEWNYPLGGMMQEISLVRAGQGFDLVYCSGGCVLRSSPRGELLWKSDAYGVHGIATIDDLDGDGRVEIVLSSGLELFVLSSDDGKLLWRATVGYPLSMGAFAFTILCHQLDKSRSYKQLIVSLFSSKEIFVFDFSEGAARGKILHKLWMDDAFHPTTAIADVDGDGVEEIVCTKLGGIYIFDPLSGDMKSQSRWESGGERRRNYGFFRLVDVDRDGTFEAVVLANRVSRHVAVLDNDGKGNFSLLWDRFIEHIYPNDTTEVRYVANSVADVDGDGLPEIVVSLYNTRGDSRWWLEIIDPITGAVKAEIPDGYLCGVQDVDEDGSCELLASLEKGRMPLASGSIEILRWNGKALASIWKATNARFATRGVPPNGPSSNFRPDCLAHDETWCAEFGGIRGILTLSENENETVVCCVSLAGGGRQQKIFIPDHTGLRVAQAADVDGCGKNELVLSGPRGEVLVVKADGTRLSKTFAGVRLPMESAFASAKPAQSAVVFHHRRKALLAVPDNLNEVHVLEYDSSSKRPRLVFKRTGKGRYGYDSSFHSPYVVDFDGDDEPVLVI
ncbi:MAG: VCBS repeat-containing protein, partial [Bacteroidota bacterium]